MGKLKDFGGDWDLAVALHHDIRALGNTSTGTSSAAPTASNADPNDAAGGPRKQSSGIPCSSDQRPSRCYSEADAPQNQDQAAGGDALQPRPLSPAESID